MPLGDIQLIRQPSSLHGHGVFTRQFIARHTPVIEFTGPLLRTDEIPDGMRAMQIGPDAWLGEHEGIECIDDFVNHSCNPNLGFVEGSVRLFALRDIQPMEELSWDYSTSINEPGWSLPCRCGAERCRGAIRSFCDLTDAQREALRPIALAYLREINR